MSSSQYRALGESGLIVSPLALGTMTFGGKEWGATEEVSREIFRAYLESDGNFIDTADIYAGGTSEMLVGKFIREFNVRDQVVLATKFGFNGSSSPLSSEHARGNPNAGGAGAKNIHRALEGSLKRLNTDFIDLYWMHIWDGVTPVEEILGTLQDLVRSGKIRYFGFSDMPAWFVTKAATIANERRGPKPIAMQLEYSLVARSVEREHVPSAMCNGMGVVPWSPLAGGFLSGKYKKENTKDGGRLSGVNPFGDSKFTEKNWKILDALKKVANEMNCTVSQAALAWVVSRPGVSSTLIGARNVSQISDNLAALNINLPYAHVQKLSECSALEPEFSDSLVSPFIRQLVYGGNSVRGWRE